VNPAAAVRSPHVPDLTILAAALTTVAVVWLAVIAAAPAAAKRGQMAWMAAAAVHAGSLVCHQRPERTFHVDGVQMPVCARCFGIYLSAAAGLTIAWIGRRRWRTSTVRLALGAAALPIAISVALEWAGLLATSNVARMWTGIPLGLVGGVVAADLLRPPRAPGAARTDTL
jgi:uncharacterized membrane protein